MEFDLSPFAGTAATLAAGIAALCACVATLRNGRRLAMETRARRLAEIAAAARSAGGLAYHALLVAAPKPASIELKNAAIAAGTQHVRRAAPAALLALGLTEAGVEALVTAELGRLLARDPTVLPGPSAATGGNGCLTLPV